MAGCGATHLEHRGHVNHNGQAMGNRRVAVERREALLPPGAAGCGGRGTGARQGALLSVGYRLEDLVLDDLLGLPSANLRSEIACYLMIPKQERCPMLPHQSHRPAHTIKSPSGANLNDEAAGANDRYE